MMLSPKPLSLFTALVASLVALSGCIGTDDGASKDEDIVRPAEADEDTCGLEGFVHDDQFNLIAGAQVGLLGTEHITLTDLNGFFSFSNVEPKTYQISATKAGFHDTTQQVVCAEGEVLRDIMLQLNPLEIIREAYSKVYGPEQGRFGCGYGLQSSSDDFCESEALDSQAKNQIDVRPNPEPITSAVFELEWTPTGIFGGKYMQLTYPVIDSAQAATTQITPLESTTSVAGNQAWGTSPVRVMLETTKEDGFVYWYAEGSIMPFFIRPVPLNSTRLLESPTDDGSSKLVVGQDFELTVTLFYNGEEVEAGYTGLGEG